MSQQKLVRRAADRSKSDIRSKFRSLDGTELRAALDGKFAEWEEKTAAELESLRPLSHEYRRLKNSKYELKTGEVSRKSVLQDIEDYRRVYAADADRLKKACEKAGPRDLPGLKRSVIESWERELDRKRSEIILKEIEERRRAFVKSIEEWLELIASVRDSMAGIGIEPGYLWDMSVGKLTQTDLSTLKRWADAFRHDENVKKICELLGRMNSASRTTESTEERVVSYRNMVPDINSREEVCGLELGRDLENVIPSELAYMNDEIFGTVFDLKFLEGRLTCFSKQGYSSTEETRTETVRKTEEDQSGPIIICVDTSGSMHGTPEYIAKAVTLHISMKAAAQKRNCFLINFSTTYATIDLAPPKGIGDLLDFMGMSFRGGPDAAPALKKAIEMTNSESYRLADILMISDFVLPPGSFDAYAGEIQKAKGRKCKFYSLTIGSFRYSNDARGNVFDEGWVYNPATGSVKELSGVIKAF